MMAVAALLLGTAAAEPRFRRALEMPACQYLGRISYSLCLFPPIALLAMHARCRTRFAVANAALARNGNRP